MFAHRIAAFTGPDDVAWTEVPEPAAEPAAGPAAGGGVVIDVAAAGVVRSGALGAGLGPGRRVAVLVPHGCGQEVISVPAERVLPLPDGMSFEAGTAAPLNYLTGLLA